MAWQSPSDSGPETRTDAFLWLPDAGPMTQHPPPPTTEQLIPNLLVVFPAKPLDSSPRLPLPVISLLILNSDSEAYPQSLKSSKTRF